MYTETVGNSQGFCQKQRFLLYRWTLLFLFTFITTHIGAEPSERELQDMYYKHLKALEEQEDHLLAPDFQYGWQWFNSPPLSLKKELRGKIVVLDFWTYCCINCMHVLPDLEALEDKYAGQPVAFIGVHSAKFSNEKISENIRQAVLRYGIQHPVVNDAEMHLWRHLGVRSWPTLLVISPQGKILLAFEGEGNKEDLDHFLEAALHFYGEKELLDDSPLPKALKAEEAIVEGPLRFPGKLAIDSDRNWLYISDSNQNRIVITSLDGQLVDTIGEGTAGLRDGSFSEAQFHRLQGLAYHADKLYVADSENHALRVVDIKKREVRTLAGDGTQGRDYRGGALGKKQRLSTPWDVAIHDGAVYIAMAGTHQVWVHDIESGTTRAFSGSGAELNLNSDELMQAAWAQPSGVSVGGEKLFIADSESSSIRRIDMQTGATATLVGGDALQPRNLFAFGDKDGEGSAARLQHPLGVLSLNQGKKVLVADTYNHRIKLLDTWTNTISAWAGSGIRGYRDGAAMDARFNEPSGFALSPDQRTLFVADTNNHKIRTIDLHTRGVSTLNLSSVPSPLCSQKAHPMWFTDPHFSTTLKEKARPLVPGREGMIRLRIQLPESHKLTQGALSRWQVISDRGLPVEIPKDRLMGLLQEDREVRIPFRAPEGFEGGVLQVEVLAFFCKEAGSCYVDAVVFELPLEQGDDENGDIALDYTLQTKP